MSAGRLREGSAGGVTMLRSVVTEGWNRIVAALRYGATPGIILGVAFVASLLVNIGMGAVSVSPAETIRIITNHLRDLLGGVPLAGTIGSVLRHAESLPVISSLVDRLDLEITRQKDAVVWTIRIPRTLLGAIIGCGLAVSGATMQGIFRNPLADPGLIGVSAGAAFGAVASIVLEINTFGIWTLPIFASLGGLFVTTLVYLLARYQGRTEIVTLLLSGVALNAIAGAAVGLLISIANNQQLRSVTFWTLGSLGGSQWKHVAIVGAVTLVGLAIILYYRTSLNLFVLGEREARHLGVEVERIRVLLIFVTACMTGAAVAFAGAIVFVGLVVPHLVRLWVGPDHRRLIPLCALAGATLLPLADLASRTIAAPTEIPIGVTMSLTGGPFFIWLLVRTRSKQGGWG